jgi:hypothetical protein
MDTRLRLTLIVALAIAVAVIVPVAWYLGSPLFISRTVDEGFPAVSQSAQGQPVVARPTMAQPVQVQPTAAQPVQANPTMAPVMATPPAQSQPAAARAAPGQPPATTMAAQPARSQPAAKSDATMPAAAKPAAPAQPVALSSGQFNEIDAIHKGEGKATIFTLPDGQRVLRLEEFKVTNGPDLFVYLSGHAAPTSGGQVHEGASFELARLKGNIGNQNYGLPADLDLSTFKSVVIYCKQFSVVFSTAALAPSA